MYKSLLILPCFIFQLWFVCQTSIHIAFVIFFTFCNSVFLEFNIVCLATVPPLNQWAPCGMYLLLEASQWALSSDCGIWLLQVCSSLFSLSSSPPPQESAKVKEELGNYFLSSRPLSSLRLSHTNTHVHLLSWNRNQLKSTQQRCPVVVGQTHRSPWETHKASSRWEAHLCFVSDKPAQMVWQGFESGQGTE